MWSIDVYYEIVTDSIFDDSDDELVDFWNVGSYLFDDIDVLVTIIDLFDQISEIKRLKLLPLLVKSTRIISFVLCLDSLPRKHKSFVVVIDL